MTQKCLLSSEIGRKSILHKSVKQYVGKCGAERHLSIKGGTEQVRQLCWQAMILAPYQTLCMSYYGDTYLCEHLHCHLSPPLRGQIYFEIVFEIAYEIIFEIVFETVFKIVFKLVFETYLKLYLKLYIESYLKLYLKLYLKSYLKLYLKLYLKSYLNCIYDHI